MRKFGLIALTFGLAGLSGCDADGDGLSDAEEKELGTSPDSDDSDGDGFKDAEEIDFGSDPLVADADADGLQDGDEASAGTDPNSADSDGDGYMDGAEVETGHSPTDAADKIYVGGWPYNPNKGDIVDPGWAGPAEEGSTLVNFKWSDQYGEIVDVYDFAGQGRPVILDTSTIWCGWCRVMAAWLGGDLSEAQAEVDAGYDWEGNFSTTTWYDVIPELIQNGDVYWLTVITENSQGKAPKQKDVEGWASDFPNDKVPVLLDEEAALESYLPVYGFPDIRLLDENLVFTDVSGNYEKVFKTLYKEYGD